MRTQATRILIAAGAAVALTVAAGCGGGGGGSAPTPSYPVPTAAPSVTPSSPLLYPLVSADATPAAGTVGVQQATASFTALGSVQYFLVSEPGQTQPFTVRGCNNVAPVTYNFQYNTAHVTDGATVLAVTATAAGGCALSIMDSNNNAASLLITVTSTTGTVS